jgi:hypothetical protein
LNWNAYGDHRDDCCSSVIVEEARRCGVEVEWDGRQSSRIVLKGMDREHFVRQMEEHPEEVDRVTLMRGIATGRIVVVPESVCPSSYNVGEEGTEEEGEEYEEWA